jgi:hypothetical protein
MRLRSLLAPLLIVAATGATSAASEADAPSSTDRRDDRGTLEAINIEGNLDLPQVLFITSQDQLRYPDDFHRTYQKDFVRVGREAKLPRRLTLSKEEK